MRTIVISPHSFEKHLDVSDVRASVFFNQFIMFKSVKSCLNQPDVISQHGKRFELLKRFPYNIGLIGYTKRSSQCVKVVYTRTRRTAFVITAYPIALETKHV